MFLYEKLFNSEYHKNILNDFINDVYKNESDNVRTLVFNIQNELNNTFSGSLISLELCAQKNPILMNVLKKLNISLDYKQIAGNVLETIVVEYINEYFKNDNNTVMVHIRNIRESLFKVTGRRDLIKTVWGRGYRIDG